MSGIRHLAEAPTETRALSPGGEVDLHRHDDAQLIYASTGVLELIVEDGTWFTPPTRAVWVSAGTAHRWQVHGATTVHLVGVPRRGRMWRGDPTLVLVPPLVRELVIACAQQGPARSPAARRMLEVLVDQLRLAPEPATMVPLLHDGRLRDVQAALEADMTVNPTLAELGRAVGASERTLSRLFRQEVGMGFTVWRAQLRLHRANLMLAEGESVTRTAAACGYSSASAFIQAFRTVFGRTPGSVYR
ncbi:helix-turn-helix transcriptional regulator [Brevibacterium yomogidense]|uniref:helix-turn-helix transcriptional regulator n=1 Tax=Brevibacterium yomogidense TaxID=946573 RepID=UPI0018E02FF5|nr:AraC family transcriptional regulator [Brevibacterium yomogidense]